MAKIDWQDGDFVDANAMNTLGAELNTLKHTGNLRYQEWETTVGNPVDTGWVNLPTDAHGLRLTLISPGSGGGSGRKGAAASVRCGGGGGSAGGSTRDAFIPFVINGTTATQYRLVLTAPGTGGAAVSASDTNGNNGTTPTGGIGTSNFYSALQLRDAGSNVIFTNLFWPSSAGVGGGNGGAMATAGGGYGLSVLGGNGSTNVLTGGTGAGASNTIAASGGGQGGGITSGDAASNGGPGGWTASAQASTSVVLPVGGIVGGALPTDGLDVKRNGMPGNGGSGGAGSTTGNAQDGRTPVGFGGGGGGGGAALNSAGNSGKGGDGGPGYARIQWVYG